MRKTESNKPVIRVRGGSVISIDSPRFANVQLNLSCGRVIASWCVKNNKGRVSPIIQTKRV